MLVDGLAAHRQAIEQRGAEVAGAERGLDPLVEQQVDAALTSTGGRGGGSVVSEASTPSIRFAIWIGTPVSTSSCSIHCWM